MRSRPFVVDAFDRLAGNSVVAGHPSHRVELFDRTIDRVLEHAELLGITRVGETTHLDVLAIPNFSVIAPLMNYPPQPGIISVFSGKGASREAALASALMETVERFCGRTRGEHLVHGSLESLRRRQPVVPPSAFIVPGSHDVADDEPIEWVPARDLITGEAALVPAFMVFTPYVPVHRDVAPRPSTSNGLASGNTIEEALLHCLYELVERDAEALAFAGGRSTTLELDGVDDPTAKDLIARFSDAGLDLQVRDITQDVAVTTFLAIARDETLPQVNYINGGKGTHLDPAVALVRALTEVAQSRVIEMAGIREDMSPRVSIVEADYGEFLRANRRWYEDTDHSVHWIDFRDETADNVVVDLEQVLARLSSVGVEHAFAVDLTQPEIGIPVARVLVPALEHDVGGAPVGPRAAAVAAGAER